MTEESESSNHKQVLPRLYLQWKVSSSNFSVGRCWRRARRVQCYWSIRMCFASQSVDFGLRLKWNWDSTQPERPNLRVAVPAALTMQRLWNGFMEVQQIMVAPERPFEVWTAFLLYRVFERCLECSTHQLTRVLQFTIATHTQAFPSSEESNFFVRSDQTKWA